ncbi:MAG TPA: iron ABC transporter permease [Thermoanaerobaculia bacterium]|nr:iron ABC transporter permease [Thermoanaerobaculia bacterium]
MSSGGWRRRGRAGAVAVALGLGWVVGYPLLLTAAEAFGGAGGWTLDHFGEFFRRADEWRALWRSTWISVVSVALAAVVGVPLAFVFERADFPGRRLLGALVALPVALPPLVGVIAFLFLYGESGFLARGLQALGLDVRWRLSGPWAILLVHAYSMYVYFYLFTRAGLARLDAALLEAAGALGAGRMRTLLRVTLPLLRPVLAGAALLTFMTALASFSAPYIFGGGFRVMTTQIVASKLNGDLAMAHVETVMLALLALGGLLLLRRIDTRADLVAGERGVAPTRVRIERRWARALAAGAGWGAALVLLLPHLTLILLSLVPPHTWTVEALPPVLDWSNYRVLATEPERLRPILNSLWMASVATLGALALGIAGARLALRHRGPLGGALEGLLVLPWAIPGTVFAIALAAAFSVSQPWALRFVLIGTPWLLPLAYLVRSLPVTGRGALAGLRRLDPTLEEAAASLGASARRTLWRVVLPALRPALVAAAGLAFIIALGDFVTSIVLYTFETRPIAIEILSSLRLQETGVAAAYGVLLMALSTAAFLVWGGRAEP